MLKPMLTFTPLKDMALTAGIASVSANDDSEPPQAALDNAMQVVKDHPGSLLEELGRARDTVEIILNVVVQVAEVSFLASPLDTLILILSGL
jgi:hypothetical protein